MCGIIFHKKGQTCNIQPVNLIVHRGPDYLSKVDTDKMAMTHTRLAIINPNSGRQPFELTCGDWKLYLTINGEIYNWQILASTLNFSPLHLKSDCEIIIKMFGEIFATKKPFHQTIYNILNMLDGVFAFTLYAYNAVLDDEVIVTARDPIGVCPCFATDDYMSVASEVKCLLPINKKIIDFPPGCYTINKTVHKYYNPLYTTIIPEKFHYQKLAELMNIAVKKRLMSDVPFALLLSGGIDSTIVAYLAQQNSSMPLTTFSIGMKNSSDLLAARRVASWLGTKHHEIIMDLDNLYNNLNNVIYYLETYDTTTIRAGFPMYLLGKEVRKAGFKMVLSGEGADEIFGGYRYFQYAPNGEEFHKELCRKLTALHKYDCLRANKAMMASGVETRVPFLDLNVVSYVMNIAPEHKMWSRQYDDFYKRPYIEKFILRSAFHKFIPDDIIWRRKEQFSDGVGREWITSLQQLAKQRDMTELQLYKHIFDHHGYSKVAHIVPSGFSSACSTAEVSHWSKNMKNDPSGYAAQELAKSPESSVKINFLQYSDQTYEPSPSSIQLKSTACNSGE